MYFIRYQKCGCKTIFLINFILILMFISVVGRLDYDDGNLATLERRPQIPLTLIRRRAQNEDLSYRRTKDIRDQWQDKVYERYLKMSEVQKENNLNAELKDDMDKLHRELKWFTVEDFMQK